MLDNARDQLGFQLPAGPPPDWVELVPAGPEVVGVDGRRWVNDTPQGIVATFQQRGRPMVIDWEHATEHRAPQGLDAPAAGWIDRMEVRAGSVWGHVQGWTARAREQLTERAYRFLSPVFQFEKVSGRIVNITSAALTNTPNLTLVALNRADRGVVTLTEIEREAARQMGLDEVVVLQAKRAGYEQASNAARLNALLSPDERRVCELMRVDPADFLAAKRQSTIP